MPSKNWHVLPGYAILVGGFKRTGSAAWVHGGTLVPCLKDPCWRKYDLHEFTTQNIPKPPVMCGDRTAVPWSVLGCLSWLGSTILTPEPLPWNINKLVHLFVLSLPGHPVTTSWFQFD